MLNKVVLPYTIWYTGLEKILRLNLDNKIDAVTNISTKATLNGSSVNDLVSAIFNPKTKSIDITIRSDARMDVDGEMKISLSYSDAKTHESILVVSVRSHENTATETPEEVKQTKLTLLNGQSHTVGAADEQVVYSFDLVNRNVTDEFATYGDVKDMLIGLGVNDSGEKDQYTILLEGDNLVLSKENDPSYRKVINLAKYHDEVSGEPLNVEDLKRDILSIVDGKLPNVETLKSDILAEAATKDAQLKADILHEVDGKITNGDTIKQEILADVNSRIPDKDTLKTEILEAAGEKDTVLKTAILEEVGTRTTQNNQSLKQEIMGEVDSKLPNTAVLKEDILGEVDTKITTNNQIFISTVMSEVDFKIQDVSAVKSEILNEVNPRLLDKENFKQEILSAIPTPANYTLTMEDDNLVLGKEGDTSYRKVINLSKYRDEVTGTTVDVEQIKRDIVASITIPNAESIKQEILQALPSNPNYTLTLNENTLTLGKEGDSTYAKTIDLSKYVNGPAVDTEQLKSDIIAAIHIPDENTIKQNILAEVNPKLIDKDAFKNEVLAAVPQAPTLTGSEILDILNNSSTDNLDKIEVFAISSMIALTGIDNFLKFHKTENSYEIIIDVDGDGPLTGMSTPLLTIPFTALRELPTGTSSEPVTIEKILELLKDESKIDVLTQIRDALGIPDLISPRSLINAPSLTDGVLKFNDIDQSPTVDFTNDFYTKSKVDALLLNAATSGSGPIEGHGRPDKKAELNNAKIGTTYVDLDRTDGAYIWMKKSKWVVIEGDTGDIPFNNKIFNNGKIRRINNTVIISPNMSNNSYINREYFNINVNIDLDNYTTYEMIHINKLGFSPLVTSTQESTWYWTKEMEQDKNKINNDMGENLITKKYLSFSCRFEFVKSPQNTLIVKFIPDYGVFPNEYENYVEFINSGQFDVIYRLFTYETDSDWPELSN